MSYFQNLTTLLKAERAEDQRQYMQLTESASIGERRANGITWYPIAIRGNEIGIGEYVNLEIERTTHHDISHSFRFGMPVALFSNHDSKVDRLEGIIAHQNGNKIKISLRVDELPDWCSDGKLGIDLLFDDNSYNEMFKALKQCESIIEKPEGDLIRQIIGINTNEQITLNQNIYNKTFGNLNQFQNEAVANILNNNNIAVVHGPPGTGKTTTLIQAIKALAAQNKKILVTAPSNTAVDLLTEKLEEEGINVIRIGNPVRVSEKLQSLTMDSKMAEHSFIKETKRLKKQAQEYKNMAHKYKRSFGKAERDQRKALFDEAHKIMKEVAKTEQYIIDDLLAKAQVITSTLVGSNHFSVRDIEYDVVIIDEAGQALEPACWIPILKGKKLVLAGDHCQLPPTIKLQSDKTSNIAGSLGTTLLEKLVLQKQNTVTLLKEQYRMHEQIMAYSSKVFYNNELIANAKVADHLIFQNDQPLSFIDTVGCSFDEKLEGTSSTNPDEAAFLVKLLINYFEKLAEKNVVKNVSIGVISPYKQQVGILKTLIESSTVLATFLPQITVNTIDSFQGQERDAMFISMCRSNDKAEIGFLADIRRMNVAITRARKKLVIVGDSATLASNKFYKHFIEYAEIEKSYFSAWEFL